MQDNDNHAANAESNQPTRKKSGALKLVGIFVLVLILLIGVGVGVGLYQLDHIVKAAVETSGTRALGVDTRVEQIDIGLFGGTCAITGVNVANPTGFETDHFMKLDSAEAAVTLGSLRQDKVEMPYVRLSGLELNIEQDRQRANYCTIMDHVKKQREQSPQPAADKQAKGYVIREVVVRDVTVNVRAKTLGTTDTAVKIPEIRLEDVGSDTEYGEALRGVIDKIVRAVLASVVQSGGGILPQNLLGDLSEQLQDVGSLGNLGVEVIGQVGKKATEQAGEAGKQATEGVGNVLKGVGGVLGGGKSESTSESSDESN